jgi:hypothetical protein
MKRGRKTKDVYYSNKEIDSVDIVKTVILFLPISLEDCMQNLNIDREKEILSNIPICPTPYQEDNCYSVLDEKKHVNTVTIEPNITPLSSEIKDIGVESSITKEIYSTRLLPEIISKNDIILKTDISCFWCCHKFETTPVFMPTFLVGDVYKVKGCFCSYECCSSYIANNSKYQKNKHLLYSMFRSFTGIRGEPTQNGFTSIVKIEKAPPREALIMFGGHLSIEEFRCDNIKYNTLQFPMVHISNQLERISITKNITKTNVKSVLPLSNISIKKKTPNNSLSKLLGIKIKST